MNMLIVTRPCAVQLNTCYDTKEQDGWILLQDGDAFGQLKEFANQMAQNDTIWSLWFDFILLLLHVVFGNPQQPIRSSKTGN